MSRDDDMQGRSRKRKIVDLDGNEINQGGRTRPDIQDNELKVKTHKYCWFLYENLAIAFKISDKLTSHVILSVALMKQAESVHNYKRQEFNKTGKRTEKFQASTIKYLGVTYTATKEVLIEACNSAATSAGLSWADPKSWMGTAQPIMSLWCLYGERYKECRIAPGQALKSKIGDQEIYVPIDRFGILPQHRQLAMGLNYSPVLKSALSQTLGPLTILSQLALADPSKNYADKWEAAAKRIMSFIPGHDRIVEALRRGKMADVSGIITSLGCIFMVTGARDQERVAFPPCFLYDYFKSSCKQSTTPLVGTVNMISGFDFSGHGAFLAYKTMMGKTYIFPKTTDMSLRQVMFHCMFGTYVEDFGILEGITKLHGWSHRSQVNEVFQACKSTNPATAITKVVPIPIIYYSKMASSLQTRLLNVSTEPSNAKMQFAGFRHRVVNGAMMELLSGGTNVYSVGRSVPEIITHLSAVQRELVRKLSSGPSYAAGTVDWRTLADITEEDHGTTIGDVAFQENGRTFWSNAL